MVFLNKSSATNKLFTSKFNIGLREIFGIKKGILTAFHPQINGQTKRMNQTLELYFKFFARDNKHQ